MSGFFFIDGKWNICRRRLSQKLVFKSTFYFKVTSGYHGYEWLKVSSWTLFRSLKTWRSRIRRRDWSTISFCQLDIWIRGDSHVSEKRNGKDKDSLKFHLKVFFSTRGKYYLCLYFSLSGKTMKMILTNHRRALRNNAGGVCGFYYLVLLLQLHNFHPVWIAAIPKVKSSYSWPTVVKPAVRIMSANCRWGGNLRIDSTRYW